MNALKRGGGLGSEWTSSVNIQAHTPLEWGRKVFYNVHVNRNYSMKVFYGPVQKKTEKNKKPH